MKHSAELGIADRTPTQEDIASSSLPADKVPFGPTGIKTEIGELKAGPAYGDLSNGRHGTFLRMPANYVSPLHSHTADYFAVVIEGLVVNTSRAMPTCHCPSGRTISKRAGRTTSPSASPTPTACCSSTSPTSSTTSPPSNGCREAVTKPALRTKDSRPGRASRLFGRGVARPT
jgi:hypothetical protein